MRYLVITTDSLGFYNLPKVTMTVDIPSFSFPTLIPDLFLIPFFPPAVHSTFIYGIPNLKQYMLNK